MGESDIRRLAGIFKGAGNHRRLRILLVVHQHRCLSLEKICALAGSSLPTISEHTRRLVLARLIRKHYSGRQVHHTLTPLGQRVLSFLPELLTP
jgi:DNA-binding MarR family transcriptional regulator